MWETLCFVHSFSEQCDIGWDNPATEPSCPQVIPALSTGCCGSSGDEIPRALLTRYMVTRCIMRRGDPF